MNQIGTELKAEGAIIVASNGDPGDDNASYVKPFYETSGYDNIYNAYNNNNGAIWQPFRLPSEGGIPFHVLFDKDGYCRATFYGGHGSGTYGFYLPYFKNLLGLP